MSALIEFASDNTAPVHPAVLDALARVNHGPAYAYGDDRWTAEAKAWFRGLFGEETEVFLVWNGTGANVSALRALTRPYQAVICATQAHINVDECGAPELLTGCKLIDLPTPDAKLTVDQLRATMRRLGDEHAVQPAVVSLTQTSEYGTAYSVDEMRAIGAAARALGVRVHMDGARIANAVVSLGVHVKTFTKDAGVDILSFGLTKDGGMGAEAVIVFDPALAAEMKYLRKQSMQLASKMRYLAAQVLAMGQDDLWLTNARHANAMAQRLADGLRAIPGVAITQKVESNGVFALLPAGVSERLQRKYHFYVWNEVTGEVRLMCSWATTKEEVDGLVVDVGG